jgi:hypothetical protein
MKSIIYIKKSTDDYKILIDYFLKRSLFFQEKLSEYNIIPAGFLINFEDEFHYTHYNKLQNTEKILLILDNTISTKEFIKIKNYLNTDNIEVFGCVLDDYQCSNKTILHSVVETGENEPHWHKNTNEILNKYSIPGFTCFDTLSVEKAYYKLLTKFQGESLRLKLGNGNNGIDHYVINDKDDLYLTLKVINKYKDLAYTGVTLELNLEDTTTYGVTRFSFNNEVISTIGKQTFKDGVYVGSELIEPNTKFEKDLPKLCQNSYKLLLNIGNQLNRFNIDVIKGKSKSGRTYTGIIDLSLRVGSATYLELVKLIDKKSMGIYHIYSPNRINTKKAVLLENYLNSTKIKVVVQSKYVFTLLYPVDEKHLLETKEFKEIEDKIQEIRYYKNPLFRR